MARHEVDVEPNVLIWARESVGLTRSEAAARLRLSDLDLRYVEEGVGGIPPSLLESMARVYARPLIAFFLPQPPSPESSPTDFRIMESNPQSPWSPELHRAYRRVASQREVMLELLELAEEDPPLIGERLSLDDDTEEAGGRVRSWLFSSEEALPEGSFRPMFYAWARLVEAKSILVTQVPNVSLREMRGFTITARPFPIIAVNNRDLRAARAFTLLHELIHVLLQLSPTGGSERMLLSHPRPDAARVERFCNAVAACVLMPRSAVLADRAVATAAPDKRWTFDELSSVSERFGVSNEAMLIRFVTLGRARWESYFARKAALRERDIEDAESGPGFSTYHPRKIRQLGRRYISSVLDAYARRDISSTEASRYLDVKIRNIPNLISEMEKTA